MEVLTFARCACFFQRGTAVCIAHKLEVCGICCSDYALFNDLKRRRVNNSGLISKHMQIYFKNKKRITHSNPKRVMARGLEQILDISREQITQIISAGHLAILVTLCGYACFAGRRHHFFRQDVIMYLVPALEMDLGLNTQQQLNQSPKKNHYSQRSNAAKNNSKTLSSPTTSGYPNVDKVTAGAMSVYRAKLSMAEDTVDHATLRIKFLLCGSLYNGNEFGTLFKEMNFFLNATETERKMAMTDAHMKKRITRIFVKYGSEVSATAPQNWTDAKMHCFLLGYGVLKKGVDRKRLSREVMDKIAKNIIEIKLAIRIAGCFPDPAVDVQTGGILVKSSQCKIPSNLNPFLLPEWSGTSYSLSPIFGSLQFMGTKVSSKPIECMQHTFYTIAKNIDQQDALSNVPMFVVRDEQQRMAIAIVVTCIKQDGNGSPLICIKYFCGKRSTFTMHKAQRVTAQLGHGQLIQTISAEYGAMKVLKKLLKKNRARLIPNVVNEAERQLHKGWRISVFMPYVERQESVSKCCLCSSEFARQRCSRCKRVVYCSRDCQKKHWKSHKIECRQCE